MESTDRHEVFDAQPVLGRTLAASLAARRRPFAGTPLSAFDLRPATKLLVALHLTSNLSWLSGRTISAPAVILLAVHDLIKCDAGGATVIDGFKVGTDTIDRLATPLRTRRSPARADRASSASRMARRLRWLVWRPWAAGCLPERHGVPAGCATNTVSPKVSRRYDWSIERWWILGDASGLVLPDPTSDPDADLLAACDRYEEADRQLTKLVRYQDDFYNCAVPDSAKEEQGLTCDLVNDHAGEVAAIPAKTLAGLRRKAHVLYVEEGDLPGHEPDKLLHSCFGTRATGN